MQYLVYVLAFSVFGVTSAFAADDSVIHFGPMLKEVIQWVAAAFGTALAAVATMAAYKIMAYFGVQATQAQRDMLQGVIVNGLNDAAAKAEAAAVANPRLDIDVKSKIVTDAVAYAQKHGAETIKALGLDPNSGEAVEAIRARIATAVADPKEVTPVVLGGPQPLAPK